MRAGVCVCVCVSKRICNNVAGPGLVGQETEMGCDISRKW